jgi:rod shape-determining protein MreB
MVAARTVNRGRPVEVEVTSAMVNEALSDVVALTARLLEECLSDAPPDLSQDISERGLTLVGGHAQLRDFADVLALATGLTVTVPENPATVVIRGLQLCLEEMASLHAVLRNVDR